MADDEDTCGFRINEEYAKKYNTWREKEELQKLKDRFGDVPEDSDNSTTSESEDEDAEGLTPAVEKDWLRTFAAVKTKNPKIYDKNIHFFTEGEGKDQKSSDKKTTQKAVYLKDYERKVILEKGGVVSESEDEDYDEDDNTYKPGYYEEQEEIKASISKAMTGEESDSDDDLLFKRTKTKEEQEIEEEDYRKWLKGHSRDLDDEVKTDLKPLKEMWSDPNLDEGDRFLRDYILNKRYLDDDEDDRIPTYDEITRDPDLSDDELLVEKQETFERKYNFRYEEPDADFIKSYPRTMGDSLRRKDERRTKKRAEIKERKEKEKEKKKQDLKQLKNLKRREIMSKLDQLKQITGNDTIGISEADIEGDFDPKQYDQLMEKAFNEEYYDDEEAEKPTFPDDEEWGFEGENWDQWTGAEPAAGTSSANYCGDEGEEIELDCEDPDFNMDCDYDPNQPEDRSFGLDGRTKKKKKSKFKQLLEKKKPTFEPGQKSFEEYLDEYYKLDYEDMIGDMPCRFKYRTVPAMDYGLSVDEILKCDDKELNAWVSLKKMSQYRTEEDEYYDDRVYSKKARNYQKKLNVLRSLAESEEEEDQKGQATNQPPERLMSKTMKKKLRRKRRREEMEAAEGVRVGSTNEPAAPYEVTHDQPTSQPSTPVKKDIKGGKKSSKKLQAPTAGIADDVGEALNDESPKKNKQSKDTGAKQKGKEDNDGVASAAKKQKLSTDRPSEQEDTPEVLADKGASKDGLKKKKKPKKQGAGVMSNERLKAFGINPKKFKYTHLPKLKEKRKKEKQNKAKQDS